MRVSGGLRCSWRTALLLALSTFLAVALAIPDAGSSMEEVRQVLSFPARKDLLSMPGLLVWVETASGVPNIWASLRTQSSWSSFQVTAFEGDAGMSLSLIRLVASNGESNPRVFFSYGPSAEANPLHLASPPSTYVYVADIDNMSTSPVQCVCEDCGSITVNAAGTKAFYSDGATVYKLSVDETTRAPHSGGADGTCMPSEVLFRTKHGSVTSLALSPDESALTFSNIRTDHAFIGVLALASKVTEPRGGAGALSNDRIQWLAPSVDLDILPVWSPTGESIAFVRFQDSTNAKFQPPRPLRGNPFSIVVADLSGDTMTTSPSSSRVVFQDLIYGYATPSGDAGYGARALEWTNETHIVFPCEVGGWMKPCLVDVSAESTGRDQWRSNMVQLSGRLECETTAWARGTVTAGMEDSLYVSDNCDFVDSRGIARIDMANGGRQQLVNGDVHSIAGMSDTGAGLVVDRIGVGSSDLFMAYIECGYNAPCAVKLRELSSNDTFTVSIDDTTTFDMTSFVKPRLIEFPSSDKRFDIHAQLFQPDKDVNASTPAIIFTHGGSQRQMFGALHYSYTYAALYALNQYFVANGFTVLSINYRGGTGYGYEFRACEGCGWEGGKEYLDVLEGAIWLQGLSSVDADRIGIYGLSYGGLNCLQALSRNSSTFKAGVANAPVFNWVSEYRMSAGNIPFFDFQPTTSWYRQPLNDFRTELDGPEADLASPQFMQSVLQNQRMAFESSPAGHMDTFESPVLLIHGDSDDEVDFEESIGLVRALRRKGNVHVETLIFPDEKHGLSLFQSQVEAAAGTFAFLQRFLNSTS